MRLLILTLSLITLAGCTVTRQAHVGEVDAATGIVRLVYDQAFLQHAHTDLDSAVLLAVGDQQRPQVLVPGLEEGVYPQGPQRGLGQWKGDADKEPEGGTAVNLGGLIELGGEL